MYETDSCATEFTLAEVMEMQIAYKEKRGDTLNEGFCRQLANKFSSSSKRAGKTAIEWEQVQSWFLEKQEQSEPKPAPPNLAIELFMDCPVPDPVAIRHRPLNLPSPSDNIKIADLSEMAFEAKSSKDYAWYDVASFRSYRVLCSGELEVKVRYAGFRNTDDEWVNVRNGVRRRSIPLEPTECNKVKVGDHVLCFQERMDHAVYCDARVLEIQKRLHDIRGCRCIFLVRYDHDLSEEKVELTRICCRPS
ncbi:hypothetical protein ACFE04_004029 [Oxalis oulophora]